MKSKNKYSKVVKNSKTTNSTRFDIAISTIIFIFLFLIDILSINIEFLSASIFYKNILDLLRIFNNSTFISQTFLTITVTFLSIFFAVYIVVVQIFRSRYPLEFIDNYFKQYLQAISYHFVINIIFGSVLLIISFNFVLSKLFYILHIIYCIYLFIKSYSKYNIFNPSKLINKYREKIIDCIDDNNLDESLITSCLNELRNYSEESLSKSEITVAKYIVNVYKDLILYFIENEVHIILCNKDNFEEIINDIEKKLLKAIISQMRLCINYNYMNHLEFTYRLLKQILELCINCDKVKAFNNFSDLIDNFFNYSINRENIVSARGVISLYGDLVKYIIEKEARDEWINILKDKIKYYSLMSSLHMNEKLLKSIFIAYFVFLDSCIKSKKNEIYDEIFDDVLMLLFNTVNNANANLLNFIKVLIISHTKSVVSTKNNQIINAYIDRISDIGQHAFNTNNKSLCIHILNTYQYISDKCDSENILKKLSDNKFDFALQSIYFEDNILSLFIPNYINLIQSNMKDMDTIEKVIDEYRQITIRSLYRNKASTVLFLLNKLNILINVFPKDKRIQQEKFLELYFDLLDTCIDMKSSENFHIVLDSFTTLFKQLDKDDKISEELGKQFIKNYENICSLCIVSKQIDFAISITHVLFHLPKKLDIISKKKSLYYDIIEILFKIGLEGIENNIDDIIRNVSDRLGWLGVYSIECQDVEVFKKIIEKAVVLINTCIDFKINEKTIIFVGTLFIVLGGYTCSNNKLLSYTNILIGKIKNIKRNNFLNNSIAIRQHQSDTWNKYMNNNAKRAMQHFYKMLDVS